MPVLYARASVTPRSAELTHSITAGSRHTAARGGRSRSIKPFQLVMVVNLGHPRDDVGMSDIENDEDSYEYAPLRLHPDTDTIAAQAQLSVAAEYGGWELAIVRKYSDGTRNVTLRRKPSNHVLLPGLSYLSS